MFGGLTDRALGFYGPLELRAQAARGRAQDHEWAHFVPDYDKWLDGTYVKQWGEENDVEVKVDHINNALLYSTAPPRSPGRAATTSSGSSLRRRPSRSRRSP